MGKSIRFFVCSPVIKLERLNVQKGVLQGEDRAFVYLHFSTVN